MFFKLCDRKHICFVNAIPLFQISSSSLLLQLLYTIQCYEYFTCLPVLPAEMDECKFSGQYNR